MQAVKIATYALGIALLVGYGILDSIPDNDPGWLVSAVASIGGILALIAPSLAEQIRKLRNS